MNIERMTSTGRSTSGYLLPIVTFMITTEWQ